MLGGTATPGIDERSGVGISPGGGARLLARVAIDDCEFERVGL